LWEGALKGVILSDPSEACSSAAQIRHPLIQGLANFRAYHQKRFPGRPLQLTWIKKFLFFLVKGVSP
jgi:hypothetical protein